MLDWNTKAISFYDRLGAQIKTSWRCVRLEGDALRDFEVSEEGKITVGQIQVELHMVSNAPEDLTTFFLAADKAKMRIFHKERNGWGCGGYKCVEYSFVSEDFLRQVNRQVVCHGEVLREAIQGDGK